MHAIDAENLPSIEVVRCKDCQYFSWGENICESWCWCSLFSRETFHENFCSNGVKKEGVENG